MRCCVITTVYILYAPTPLANSFYFSQPLMKNIFRIVFEYSIKKNLGTYRERIGLAVPRSKHLALLA